MIYDGTGSLQGGTGWYLVVLAQSRAVLVDIWWYCVIAERPDSEPVPVQRGDGAFISSGFSPECISLCVVVSESKAH